MSSDSSSLQHLLSHGAVWRARHADVSTPPECLSSGFPLLDEMLPGQGWQPSQLVELLYEEEGSGELRMVLPLLAQLSQQRERWVLWVDPPHIPYAPALQEAGIDLGQVLVVRSSSRRDRLWCLEQSLKSGCCSAVLGWLPPGQENVTRRLQVAATEGRCHGFLFRSLHCKTQNSAAACRLQLEPAPEGVSVSVLKRRGGWPLPPRLIPLARHEMMSEPQSDQPVLQLVRKHSD